MLPYMALEIADVITSRVLRWGDCPGVGRDTPTLSKWHHKSLYRRKAGGNFTQKRECEVTIPAEDLRRGYEDRGRSHKAKSAKNEALEAQKL